MAAYDEAASYSLKESQFLLIHSNQHWDGQLKGWQVIVPALLTCHISTCARDKLSHRCFTGPWRSKHTESKEWHRERYCVLLLLMLLPGSAWISMQVGVSPLFSLFPSGGQSLTKQKASEQNFEAKMLSSHLLYMDMDAHTKMCVVYYYR